MKVLGVLVGLVVVTVLAAPWHGDREPADDQPSDAPTHAGSPGHAHGAPAEVTRTIDLDAPRPPRQWFRPLDELLADPSLNPDGRRLTFADQKLAIETFQQASDELQAIEDAFSKRQAVLARERIEQGRAEPFEPGVSDTHLGDSAAVVVGSIDGSPQPWLVRLGHDELPEAAAGRQQVEAIRAHAFFVLDTLLSESPVPAGEGR